MKNSAEIFEIGLGLNPPWYIKDIEFEKDGESKVLHISIDFEKGHKFIQEDGREIGVYDTRERTWQHQNFFQHKCFIHARVPRVKMGPGKVALQQVPWARKGSGFTLLFEAYAMLLIESEMPVSRVAEILGCYPQRIWNIFGYWISLAHSRDRIKELINVGFDETSTRKGHNYITTMVDMKERRVLYATEGKGADTIAKSVEYLKGKDVEVGKIENACIDMSPAFKSGCAAHLPNTAITFDKFHVIKEVNKAMDELRKLERKGNAMLKGHKYTFLKSRLAPEIKEERDLLMEYYPKLGEGYRLKELFWDFWDLRDSGEAEGYLAFWCDLAEESKIRPFIKVSNTIKAHWSGIVNYIKSRINNGILEGINAKIQLAKKRARGYRKTSNFINMVYFIAGKLNFDYPHYSI